MSFLKRHTLLLTALATITLIGTASAKTLCNQCKGTGKILEVTKQCPLHKPLFGHCANCDGSGLIGPPCPYCGGVGYILTPAEKEAEKKARAKADAKAQAEQRELEAKSAREDSVARVEQAQKEADLKGRGITNKRKHLYIEDSLTRLTINKGAIRSAYNNGLRKAGKEGYITVKFIINGQGKVISIQMVETTMKNSELESVVINSVKNTDFGKLNELNDMTEHETTFSFSPDY